MATTYITKTRRAELINEFMECWHETESYSSEDRAEAEGVQYRADLEAMNNSELVAEITASGWGIL